MCIWKIFLLFYENFVIFMCNFIIVADAIFVCERWDDDWYFYVLFDVIFSYCNWIWWTIAQAKDLLHVSLGLKLHCFWSYLIEHFPIEQTRQMNLNERGNERNYQTNESNNFSILFLTRSGNFVLFYFLLGGKINGEMLNFNLILFFWDMVIYWLVMYKKLSVGRRKLKLGQIVISH